MFFLDTFLKNYNLLLIRYQNESRSLFEVLDIQLSKNEWLAGEYSIADIANWCWVRTHNWSGVSTDGLNSFRKMER